MRETLKAIKYRNLDQALEALAHCIDSPPPIFDDGGQEPQGLLAVTPEDRLPEEVFYQLFGLKEGVLVEVERIFYSGYGPPAEETDYMGFIADNLAYVLVGCRYAIEIDNCPAGASDIHHLEALVMDHEHPINRDHVAEKLRLPMSWDFDDLFDLVIQGQYTGEEIDRVIHQGIQ